ncbi:MAG: glycosyltransferase family 4 protein [Promethearchaeota archaeon]
MKITFVTSHLTVFTGAGKFIMDYANRFCERGHEMTVVAQKINQDNFKFNEKIELIEVGGPLPSNLFHWLRFKKIIRRYSQVLNKIDTDLIFSQYFPSAYCCAKSEKRKYVKHVNFCQEPYLFFHNKEFYSNAPLFLKIYSKVLRHFFKKFEIEGICDTDEIICNSYYTNNKIKDYYNRESLVHYIGVDCKDTTDPKEIYKLEQILNLKKNTPIIFALGLTHHMKGTKELILILKIILEHIPETILLIGGWIKKENITMINKLIKKLKLPPENIILYGFIESKLLKYFYEQSYLTFYTALNEALGLIPLESMFNGTPVIAFEEGGPKETILDGKTGYLIKNRNLNEFAEKAINLMKDKELYNKFSENAKEHVKTNYCYKKLVPDLELILLKIINKN